MWSKLVWGYKSSMLALLVPISSIIFCTNKQICICIYIYMIKVCVYVFDSMQNKWEFVYRSTLLPRTGPLPGISVHSLQSAKLKIYKLILPCYSNCRTVFLNMLFIFHYSTESSDVSITFSIIFAGS